jgi:site-specific DNA-methyltransferase (adenine-specific)
MSSLFETTYNPDVLSCLANLSNDEVFTPPELANQMLDLLPDEIWSDPDATFLDPACKSGVFLREIAKRLIEGLKDEIPDLQERLDHIYKKQIFGIAITELTSLLSRRSLYCSKYPNSKYSVVRFDGAEGNVRFRRCEHTWRNGRCTFCGASQEELDRGGDFETHAYEFIHTFIPEELFSMKFDVIIGNPPYQLDTAGAGRQARPIYNLFVGQAMKLQPRYLAMIIPSRWFAGGMGLDSFREKMTTDGHVRVLVDYANAKDCFPQNSISGGVCYFLWDRDNPGDCQFTNVSGGKSNTITRSLSEWPVLVRYNDAVNVIRRVQNFKEPTLDKLGTALMPFGLSTKVRGTAQPTSSDDLVLHSSAGVSYFPRKDLPKGQEKLAGYKVLMSKTGAEHAGEPDKDGQFRVLTKSMSVIGPNHICTHSYFLIGQFDTEEEARHLLGYLQTRFVRFLVLQMMTSINVSKAVFQFVPQQDWTKTWTDEVLFNKYGLTDDDVEFINKLIKPFAGDDDAS